MKNTGDGNTNKTGTPTTARAINNDRKIMVGRCPPPFPKIYPLDASHTDF